MIVVKNFFYLLSLLLFLSSPCFFFSCSNDDSANGNDSQVVKNNSHSIVSAPRFNEDSAFAFVKAQVDFGPRIPATPAHAACAEFFVNKFKEFGFEVTVQTGTVISEGKNMPMKNIIASFHPERNNRFLLAAHWDTRPFSDRDEKEKDKPFDGANDGASGAAVLLEIARQFGIAKPALGIDIILFDMEDYGKEYCLGSEYWGKNLHKPGYVAQYGILLDMVGAQGAVFPREGLSRKYAPFVVKKIWNKASHLGYSHYFIFQDIHELTDDHYNIITLANIPCMNIIHFDPATQDFGTFHHRQSDNMNIIDKNTLKAVGQTVLEVIWEEQEPGT